MMWQPRRCGGMTTVLWAQRGVARAPGAAGAGAAARSHRTTARAARRGRAVGWREWNTGGARASAGAVAAAGMIGLRDGGGIAAAVTTERVVACRGCFFLFFLAFFVWV